MTSTHPVSNLVVVSDTHCGCRLGLCPPGGAKMDDGGFYKPSRLQLVMWGWWQEFWGKFVPRATKGEPYAIVHNGDLTEGVHHRATSQISHNLEDQAEIAYQVMAPRIKKAVAYYQIRGTPAHTGEQGVAEEALAKRLGAIRNRDGQAARYELWKRLGKHHVHFLHHVGTTASAAHESSAVNAELTASYVEAARWGEQPPSVIVRSHRHRAIEIRFQTSRGMATAAVTPAWQLKTPFAWKVAGARLAPPQIGGMVIRLDTEGVPYTQSFVKNIERDPAE